MEDELARVLASLAEESRSEGGNVAFVVARSPIDRGCFFVFEYYDDEEAIREHAASEHFDRYARREAPPLLATERSEAWESL